VEVKLHLDEASVGKAIVLADGSTQNVLAEILHPTEKRTVYQDPQERLAQILGKLLLVSPDKLGDLLPSYENLVAKNPGRKPVRVFDNLRDLSLKSLFNPSTYKLFVVFNDTHSVPPYPDLQP
jgi:hypothetical protein